jgi:hypothetical protein
MKKALLVLATCFACIQIVSAQFKVALSTPFEEPEDGWNKLLQLRNGNTFFFHFTKKEGIEVTVYDKSRNVIATKTLTSELWEPRKMRESVVEGLYEIGGQPVIFLQQMIDRTPSLFRIKLDPNTGEVAGEKLISTLPKYKAGSAWAMAFGGVDAGDFYVEKDPASDNYAVINFNSFAHESGERIEMIHYTAEGGNHKILNRAFYDSPNGQFKYLRFIGMTVDGDKQVFISTYGFNTKSSGEKDSRVIVSRIKTGEKDFTHNLIEFTDDFRDTRAIMQYNPGSNIIQLLTLTLVSSKSKLLSNKTTTYYMTLMTGIDPQTLRVVYARPFMAEKVSAEMQAKVGEDFRGLPQQMIINGDHSTTLLMEEMTTETIQTRTSVSYRTYLNNIGITELDDKAREENGYVVFKSQMANGLIDPLYVSHKSKGLWSYRGAGGMFVLNNNAFLSFDYVSTDRKRYVLYNDYTENLDRTGKKRKTVVAISDANTVCYELDNGRATQSYLFGNPGKDAAKFCYIESSHFLPETKTYATLMMTRDGRKKQASIAWVKFE